MGHYYETVGHILAQHHKPKVSLNDGNVYLRYYIIETSLINLQTHVVLNIHGTK